MTEWPPPKHTPTFMRAHISPTLPYGTRQELFGLTPTQVTGETPSLPVPQFPSL